MKLRPAGAEDLPPIMHWFDDAQTQRWLGGRDWPEHSLRLRSSTRHLLLGAAERSPIVLIDVEHYPQGRASFALVTAPAQRRQGVGGAAIKAMIAHFADKIEFFAGVEQGNTASGALLARCGFVPVRDQDADGFSYHAWFRSGAVPPSWDLP